MSIRRISNKGGNIIGSFPSLKNNKPVPYESTIERDLLYFLEYDPSVSRYVMQPFTIRGLIGDGITRTYTPDVLVEYTTGQTIIECKPAAHKETPHTQQQITLGKTWADTNNCEFALITDEDLRTGYRLANLKLLWRYSRLPVPHTITQRCLWSLRLAPAGVSLAYLATILVDISPSHINCPYIYALIFQHVLTTNINLPLNPESHIYLAAPLRT